MALTKSERELLSQIAKKPTVLKTASATTLKKKEFIKEAVAITPKAIKYADEEILKDYTFLLKLVSGNGMVAAYIPAKYTNTHMFLKAIENTLEVEPFIPRRVYKDMADGMGIWEEKPYIKCHALSQSYFYFRDDLIANKNMAVFISKHFMAGFDKRIPEKYRSDKDVAMAAVRTMAHNFYYIDKSLRSDIDIIKCAYRNDPVAFVKDMNIYSAFFTAKQDNLLKPFRSTLVNDREFIKDCLLSGDVCVLEPEYADDEEIALMAMRNALEKTVGDWHDAHKKNYALLSDRLKLDDRIIRMELENNGQSLSYMPDSVKDNEKYAKLALSNTVYAAKYVSERLMNDKSFVEEVVLLNHDVLEYVSDSLLKDAEFIRTIFVNTPIIFEHIPARLLKDKEFVLDVLANGTERTDDFSILKTLPKKFADDEEVVAAACVANSGSEFRFASKRLQESIDFVLNLMMSYDIDLTGFLSEEISRDKEVQSYLKKWDLKKRFDL